MTCTTEPPAVEPLTLDPMIPITVRLRRVRKEATDTVTLELEPAHGARRFPFVPGQFNMLYVYGVGEVPASICGDPSRSTLLMHTTRAVGGVTRAITRLKRGALLGVRGPFGCGWPVNEAVGKDVVLVAGGMGLASLRPVIYQLLDRREDFGRLALLYGNRTPGDIVYRRELKQWRKVAGFQVLVTVDYATEKWAGPVGVLPEFIAKLAFDPRQAMVMVSAPEALMRYTVRQLNGRGLTDQCIHVSVERSLKCAVGSCGRCQLGGVLVCRDGPIFRLDRIREFLEVQEV